MNKINICHISDLHFGIFENKTFSKDGITFNLPDSFINFLERFKKIRHDVILRRIKTRHFILQLEPVKSAEILVEFIDESLKSHN